MKEVITGYHRLSFHKINKHKKIGFVRPDNHSLVYGYCMGQCDRQNFLEASGQLYILEHQSEPTLPLRGTEVSAVWWTEDPDAEVHKDQPLTANNFAKAFPGCKVFTSLEEMADPNVIDGVIIGNCHGYGSDHVELSMPFIEKGVPLFIDKPFAANAKDAATILNAAREYNTPIFCASILYYDISNQNLKRKNMGSFQMSISTLSSEMEKRNASVHTISNILGAKRYIDGDYRVKSMRYIGTKEGDSGLELYLLVFTDGTVGIVNCNSFGTYAFHNEVYGTEEISSEYTVEETLRKGIVDIAYEFSNMLDTGKPPVHYDNIFEFVATIDAALLSKAEGGREVTIEEIAKQAGYVLGEETPCREVIREEMK